MHCNEDAENESDKDLADNVNCTKVAGDDDEVLYVNVMGIDDNLDHKNGKMKDRSGFRGRFG